MTGVRVSPERFFCFTSVNGPVPEYGIDIILVTLIPVYLVDMKRRSATMNQAYIP